jgi:putative membrane protein
MSSTQTTPSSRILINAVSAIVPLVVALLLGIQAKVELGAWTKVLPHVIGGINTLTALLLVVGFVLIRFGKVEGHRWAMTSAFLLGGCFLVCYITYHLSNPSTHFGGEGTTKMIYYGLLLSHIALSILVLPLVLRAFIYALTSQFEAHKRVAKFAFPIWLYVSVSGVLVYLMISPYYPKRTINTAGEAGEARIDQPANVDPGDRKLIAQQQEQAKEFNEEQLMRSFSLTERSGKTISSQELRGQPFIASFFFSTCPGSCKQQNDQMRLLQQKYRDTSIRLVSISVDPEKDTPEVLDAYANSYGADKNKWLFFTGDIKYITRMASDVFFLGQIGPKSHPDRFCLFDADGKLVGKYDWHESEQLKQLDEHVQELLGPK